MKARASYLPPDSVMPDVGVLAARYLRLISLLRVLILAGNYTQVLKTSLDIGRAARALIRGKARLAAEQTKAKMLACPGWRARVIADLGGVRKLALWQAAMGRALKREHDRACFWQPPAPLPGAQIITPATIAAAEFEAARRAHIRNCAKACANPRILKDPFRVDQDGLFRLPPVPRAPAVKDQTAAPREYTFDPRKITNLTGAFAPAMVWPAEFYIAELGGSAEEDTVKALAFGPTCGAKRRPARRDPADCRPQKNVPYRAMPLRRSPKFAPP